MDAFARGLKNAAKLIEEEVLEKNVEVRNIVNSLILATCE